MYGQLAEKVGATAVTSQTANHDPIMGTRTRKTIGLRGSRKRRRPHRKRINASWRITGTKAMNWKTNQPVMPRNRNSLIRAYVRGEYVLRPSEYSLSHCRTNMAQDAAIKLHTKLANQSVLIHMDVAAGWNSLCGETEVCWEGVPSAIESSCWDILWSAVRVVDLGSGWSVEYVSIMKAVTTAENKPLCKIVSILVRKIESND